MFVVVSYSVISNSLHPHGLQCTRFPCPAPSPEVCSNSCVLSWWYHLSHPLSPSSPAFGVSQHQGLFQWVSTLNQVVQVLELQHKSFQWIFRIDFLWDWLVLSPFCPRDSQETSPAPQFKSINSSALNLFYGPALTSIPDYWKNHSFDYMNFCQQRAVSAFKYAA